ncbi:MAG TPA: SpoIID/LytB domain-containing protein [Blastocatellia bacterium]|nr:SpoIID/LytB domain-containing protein [Blastocatellia bacterium]
MTISLTGLRSGQKVVSLVLLFTCAPITMLAQNPAISKNHSDEDNASRPRKIDSHEATGLDGPIVRIGLLIDVAAVSLSSPSELTVRRQATDDRASYTVSSGEMRVEARRIAAAADAGKYKPRARYTEATNKPAANKSTAHKSPNNKPAAKAEAPAKTVPALTSQVIAFEANQMVASSESLLIVSASETGATRADSEAASKSPRTDSLRPVPFVRVGNKDYRGDIHLVLNSRGRINVINQLPLELYLRGVVPRELSPAAFPLIEALKAQAIAARSYALSTIGRFRNEGFDLRDDAQSQVYDGLRAEHPLTNRAVEETRGMAVVYKDEEGRIIPIEALYTSTCGGRTENNEAIFLTKAVPYLRSVECAPDRTAPANREIVSDQMAETISGAEGHLARAVALLEVLGFSLPRPVTSKYLRGAVDEDELRGWMERAAKLARQALPATHFVGSPRRPATSLPAFASLVAAAMYGNGRASLLLSPADIDYMLAGLGGEDVPREMRADIAMLLKDGVLRLAADSRLDARAPVTRGYVVETLVRALTHKVQVPGLKSQTARPAENGRLILAGSTAKRATVREAAVDAIEIDRKAWLFRRFADMSFAVDRLTLVGGERVTYHVNAAGRVDFLEAEISDRGAASDRLSGLAQWRERITVDELRRRLGRYRVSVGELESLAPITYGESNRVLEIEIIGAEGRARLRGFQIRNALGLKENLFVIDREMDEQGRAVAFVFTGRGWGHGVGMCQTGAAGLAREGYSYTSILQKYYTNVKIQRLY